MEPSHTTECIYDAPTINNDSTVYWLVCLGRWEYRETTFSSLSEALREAAVEVTKGHEPKIYRVTLPSRSEDE